MSGPYREGGAPGRLCPRCRRPLGLRPLADEAIEECGDCFGYFVHRTLLPRILDALDLGGEVLETFERGTPSVLAEGPLYVHCPACDKLMARRQFAAGARVVIDECREHGMWFDRAELRAVVEFVAGGGLERAAEAEARRRLQEKRREQLRAVLPGIRPEQEKEHRFIEFILRLFG